MASRSTTRTSTSDLETLVAQAVASALAGQAAPKGKGKGKTEKPKADYDLSKSATRSQVFRAFFAMAKAHHGLTFKSDEWPTSGDIQDILDALK